MIKLQPVYNMHTIIDTNNEPYYYKLNSVYGYLVVMCNKVFHVYGPDGDLMWDDVTDQFNIIEG
jgi:hypothetical protein